MLKFSEELVLLALDEKSGVFRAMPEKLFGLVLAAAILFDLAEANRIDSDIDSVYPVNPEPLKDPVSDKVLKKLFEKGLEKIPSSEVLSDLAYGSEAYTMLILLELVRRGILQQKGRKFLWVFTHQTYSPSSDADLNDVKRRIRAVVQDAGAIPSWHDAIIVSLMNCAGLSDSVFTPEQLNLYSGRIAAISKMDLLACALAQTIERLHRAIMDAIAGI